MPGENEKAVFILLNGWLKIGTAVALLSTKQNSSD
jgi:hypothetical protein